MKISSYLFTLLFLTSITSCVTDLPIDEQGVSIPVVNCVLTNDSVQKLSLTRSVKISESYIFKEIKDAVITLSINDSVVGSFTRLGYDNWQLKYFPQAGKTYQLKVVLSNGKVLTASSVMPASTTILQKTDIDSYPSKNFCQYTAAFPCWVIVLNSDGMLLPQSRPLKTDYANEDIGTNHPFADRFNQNGNLTSTILKADTPKYSFYIRVQAGSINSVGGIDFKLQTNFGYHTLICFRTASVEYDKYTKSCLQKVLKRLDTNDPISWFDESQVFSNINNGTGIFAAYSDQFYNYNDDDSYLGN